MRRAKNAKKNNYKQTKFEHIDSQDKIEQERDCLSQNNKNCPGF